MHAYKDAIPNSLGAYILYPGDECKIFNEPKKQEFVGVGAIPLKPTNSKNHVKTIIETLINNELEKNHLD